MSEVVALKGVKQPPKSVRSKMDTLILTPKIIDSWTAPPFQRPLKINERVRSIAEQLKHNNGVIDGILTLGVIAGDPTIYLLDGQHRVAAMRLSELNECIVDVRICNFDNMGEMGDEFVKLNSAIVKMNPDDVLRAMEGTIPSLHNIKEACPFVGYENVRRGHAPKAVLSMSAAVRTWMGSANETPKQRTDSAVSLARELSAVDAQDLIRFLNLAKAAWGSEPENYRLWTALNLCLCMWLYRRLVLDKARGVRRYVVLNADIFKKCLMSVAATGDYVDWLVGRSLSERDRAPCYMRLKMIFVSRLKIELNNPKPMMPQPPWVGSTNSTKTWVSTRIEE